MRFIAVLFLVLVLLVSTIFAFEISGKFEVPKSITEPSVHQEGGGGSRGAFIFPNITKLLAKNCERNWKCGQWSECESFLKKRTCSDANYCRDPLTKIEQKICVSPQIKIEKFFGEQKHPIKTTTFIFKTLFSVFLILFLIVVILIIREIIDKFRRKKQKKNNWRKRKRK